MRSRAITVLHLLAPAGVGGIETVVRALASGHAGRGHRVRVAGILDTPCEEHPFGIALEKTGVEFVPLLLPGRRYWRERRAVADLLRDLRPDVLHTHGYRPDVIDTPVARRMGTGSVSTVHGFDGEGLWNHIYERLQLRAFRRLDAVVPVSEKLGRELVKSGVPKGKVRVIRNAWMPTENPLGRKEAREILGLPQRAFTIGWIGRPIPEKSVDTLIRAFALLGVSEARLSLIGAGSQDQTLRALADELSVHDRIHWHGVVPEAPNLFAAFDAFALTSLTEGTPMVLLEAMASGTPIVTTDVGGIPDVVSAREAVLVPPGEPESVAEALLSVHNDPQSARMRAEAAKRRLESEFTVDSWLDQYEQVYDAVGRLQP